MSDTTPAAHGLTTADVAKRYRVGQDRVRAWIAAGELRALNTADARCGRPRYVVTPEALAEFERRRAAGPPPKAPRRCRQSAARDYYPD